jgi:hypothetical protein
VQNLHIQRALDYQQWKSDPANKNRSFEDFELGNARTVANMDRFGDLRKQAEEFITPADSGAPSGTTSGGLPWRVK